MKLDFLPLAALRPSPVNMRGGRRAPDIADILPLVRARGVLVPLLVRAAPGGGDAGNDASPAFEIVAGRRRYEAARLVAEEAGEIASLPCAILETGDDADAAEASIIENVARLDPDEVTRWEAFVRLVRAGRSPEQIAATFGLPEIAVRRTLALGNLLPRIRDLYRREEIDAATIRHLTLASKARQRDWLALVDDPEAYAPTGPALKTWLFGGASIPTSAALFALDTYQGAIVADLFGEGGYFAEPEAFWAAQNAAITAKRDTYLGAGWREVVVVPPGEHFQLWEHERAPKRRGGRVYLDVSSRGDVAVHEGYVTRREARKAERGEGEGAPPKPARPEVSGPMQTYVDLHRHAAVRAALAREPGLALRLVLAHIVHGSPLWSVKPEPQAARSDAIVESVESCLAEADFDRTKRDVLASVGVREDRLDLVRGYGSDYDLNLLFRELIAVPDDMVMRLLAVAMAETLAAGSVAVEALGTVLPIDMASLWRADAAFLDLVRDKAVVHALVADVAGEAVAAANAGETGKACKAIIRDHLDGANGRPKVEGWVPRWLAFPPAAYTDRGGVGCVARHACAVQIAEAVAERNAAADDESAASTPELRRAA